MRDFITDRKVAFKEYLTRPMVSARINLWVCALLYVVGLAGWFVMAYTLSAGGAGLLAWFFVSLYFFTAAGTFARWVMVAFQQARKVADAEAERLTAQVKNTR